MKNDWALLFSLRFFSLRLFSLRFFSCTFFSCFFWSLFSGFSIGSFCFGSQLSVFLGNFLGSFGVDFCFLFQTLFFAHCFLSRQLVFLLLDLGFFFLHPFVETTLCFCFVKSSFFYTFEQVLLHHNTFVAQNCTCSVGRLGALAKPC